MDQLKVFLKVVQKHHFWLLCMVAMTAALVGWFMARSSLSTEYTKNKGTIVGKFTSLNGILTTPNHPNSTWTEAVGQLTNKEKEIVRNAWQKLYDEQKTNLEWPPELGESFLKFVNTHPPTAEIHSDLRGRYQDLIIKSEFPRLLAIVDAAAHNAPPKANTDTRPQDRNKKTGAPVEEPPPAHEYKVVWDDANQKNVEKMLDFSHVPTSAEVRQAQEDIWMYKALLTIIRAMNTEQGTGVRKITEISIGPAAAAAFQAGMAPDKIEHLKQATAVAAQPAAPPQEGSEPAEKGIDEGRYVEFDGKPLPAGTAATQQFKRMPIFMRLSIDQRDINKLLVECANSQLPVEVRQLRVNPLKRQSGSSPRSGGQGNRNDATAASESEFYEVPIELVGIIYIYNPPDMTKLGSQQGGSSAAGAGGQ
jgi:hypothetical protein